MSAQGIGPKCIFQNDKYRIESYFDGRPISVWEMRNPTLLKLCINVFVAFNFNRDAIDRLLAYKPLDTSRLELDVALKDWAPIVKKRLPSIRGKLLQDNGREHPNTLKIVDAFDKNFLFKGYEEYFESLIDRKAKMVLCHNDGQENNILVHLQDNEKMIHIDFEYGGFNPIGFDIANYWNECICDN